MLQSDYSDDVEKIKRIARKRFQEFPKITFIIYIIFALTNAILMGYLLTLNYNNDQNMFNFIIIWSLFLLSVIVFIVNSILFLLEFPYKKIILAISIIIQTILAGTALILANTFGHISPSDQLYFYMSNVLNVITGITGFVPLYLVY